MLSLLLRRELELCVGTNKALVSIELFTELKPVLLAEGQKLARTRLPGCAPILPDNNCVSILFEYQ